MCLILVAYDRHPVYKLIVAANRDEFYKRPAEPAHFWEDKPAILAGRDLEKKGTWMGVTQTGRFAALTNYRDPQASAEGKRSRGELVVNTLEFQGNLKDYMERIKKENDLYPGYNLLAGDAHQLYYYSNVGQELKKLTPGIHGVSNHLLNTLWPKVKKGKVDLAEIIKENNENLLINRLFDLLKNDDTYEDHFLPKTGVSLEWERTLSPLFIKSNGYGTRSSTVMLMSNTDIQYIERIFTPDQEREQTFQLKL